MHHQRKLLIPEPFELLQNSRIGRTHIRFSGAVVVDTLGNNFLFWIRGRFIAQDIDDRFRCSVLIFVF